MKQLNKWQSLCFMAGGGLMVLGAGAFVLMWMQPVMCWVFMLGALMFASMQLSQTYEGNSLTVGRLKRIQAIADLLFVLAAILMVDHAYGYFRPLFANVEAYLTYIYNKWVILLLVAAVLEVYTVHRLDYELSKQNIKD